MFSLSGLLFQILRDYTLYVFLWIFLLSLGVFNGQGHKIVKLCYSISQDIICGGGVGGVVGQGGLHFFVVVPLPFSSYKLVYRNKNFLFTKKRKKLVLHNEFGYIRTFIE